MTHIHTVSLLLCLSNFHPPFDPHFRTQSSIFTFSSFFRLNGDINHRRCTADAQYVWRWRSQPANTAKLPHQAASLFQHRARVLIQVSLILNVVMILLCHLYVFYSCLFDMLHKISTLNFEVSNLRHWLESLATTELAWSSSWYILIYKSKSRTWVKFVSPSIAPIITVLWNVEDETCNDDEDYE